MKYLISSVTIGACLLLSSAGVVFADPPHMVSPSVGGGQLGTVGTGIPMPNGGTAACGPTQPSPLGQANNTSNNSPFNTVKEYAGSGEGNYGEGTGSTPNPHANSQYDNSCLRQVP
jgi:hypothetical protein